MKCFRVKLMKYIENHHILYFLTLRLNIHKRLNHWRKWIVHCNNLSACRLLSWSLLLFDQVRLAVVAVHRYCVHCWSCECLPGAVCLLTQCHPHSPLAGALTDAKIANPNIKSVALSLLCKTGWESHILEIWLIKQTYEGWQGIEAIIFR